MVSSHEALKSLSMLLTAEREAMKEKLASGLPDDRHYEIVGRCKALAWSIDKVHAQIKSILGGDDDENRK